MYSVSSEYLKAVSKPNREFKLLVRFYYKDGSQASFDDHTISGDVEILSQAISGSASSDKIDIGAAIAAKAILSIIDNDVNLHRYTGSSFEIYVYLKLENGEFEEVPMGRFYTDPSKLSRIKNKINIVGYDSMLSLMYALTDDHRRQLKGSTAADAVQFLAAYSNCGFEQDLSVFPNNSVPLDFDSPQVETARDGVMWIAQLLGCFAHIDRRGYLEFVPIKSTWKYYNDEHTVGTIIAVRNIQGSERYKTTFSDDRIHIVGLSMPDSDNKLITCVRSGLKDDANITIALDRNPLVINSSIPLKDILNAILNQARTTYFYAFKTEIISDPALDAGDTIRLQGGVINGTNKNNDLIGFITHNVWRYRGHHEITNAGQVPIVYAEGETATVAFASDTTNLSDSDSDLFYLPPKSQAEKASAAGNVLPDRLVSNNVVARLSGYGSGRLDFRDENASYPLSYLGEMTFSHNQYSGPELYVRTGASDRSNRTEIRIENSLRVLCQKGTIQYGDDDAYPHNGSPNQGRICLNANDNDSIYPAMLVLNTPQGYSYSIEFSPNGVTFSNGIGGSFTIPFATETKEEE